MLQNKKLQSEQCNGIADADNFDQWETAASFEK